MKKSLYIGLVWFIPGLLLLTACGDNAQVAAPTQQVAEAEDQAAESDLFVSGSGFGIEVEGRIFPNQTVNLSFKTSGQVAEVLVQEGDMIKAGDVIARLGDRETLDANLANTEQAQISAELALTNAKLALTNAKLALLESQNAYDVLYENWPDMAIQAEQDLTDARKAARDAERDLGYKTGPASQLDIDVAWSQVILALDALENAEEDFEPFANKPEDDLVRATVQAKLAEAQKVYNRALSIYNALSNPSGEFEITQAEAKHNIAQAQLAQAQKDFDALLEGPDPKDVALAEARIESVEARIESAEAQITAAELNIATTQTNVVAAQAALDKLGLIAPMDGTIAQLDLNTADQVIAGVPVAILADFSSWKVETFDLTERDVPEVFIGQQVTIILDALPDLELSGTVEHISDVYTEKGGDITYTARILLDEGDANLRWGMTVLVTFIE